MRKVAAQSPWTRAFREEMALPSGVVGPADFWALARLALSRRPEGSRRFEISTTGLEFIVAILVIILINVVVFQSEEVTISNFRIAYGLGNSRYMKSLSRFVCRK